MTREQYEQRKRRLEEQLRAGIQLLESAYLAQVRALDLVWMLQAEEAGTGAAMALSSLPSAVAPAPASQERSPVGSQPPPHGQRTYKARDEIYAALARLPEAFTRNDVCKAIGYAPNRGILFHILRELVREGHLRIVERGAGQRATVYAKTDAEVPSPG